MKKYILCLLILTVFVGQTYDLNAQLRTYPKPQKFDGDGAGIGGGDERAVVDRFGRPICCESGGFSHTLSFSSFANLLTLENKILKAQWAEVKRWLDKQEETFRKEINKQLRTNYSTFKQAQRAYFKHYEAGPYGDWGAVREIRKSRNSYRSKGNNEEIKAFNALLDYKILDDWISCGYCPGLMNDVFTIDGLQFYENENESALKVISGTIRNNLYEKFSDSYYLSGQFKSLSEGFKKLDENDYLLNKLVDARVKHYENSGLQESVFLMSSYLTPCTSYVMACMPYQLNKYRPPNLWSVETLEKWAKEKAPDVLRDKYIFSYEYLHHMIYRVGGNGFYYSNEYIKDLVDKQRQEVIDRLLEAPFYSEEFLTQKMPDYTGQRVTNPRGKQSRIHENAFTIENNKGQTIAFVTPDEKFFFWNGVSNSYSQSETSPNYRFTYFAYVEDKYMRQSEPITWGIYSAADDLGGFILDLVGSPNQTIRGFASGIERILKLDFDLNKTWDRIVNADLTDASYIAATLAMGHLSGPKGAGLISSAEMGQFQQFMARYSGKVKPVKLTWPELLELFKKARQFENAVSNHLKTLYTSSNGFKTFKQVYLKVDGVVSIADDLIYNSNTRKWILNESKYGIHNTLSKNQQIIQDAIKAGKKIEIRSAGQLIPGVGRGGFIKISEILRSHSTNGTINFNTVKTIWRK